MAPRRVTRHELGHRGEQGAEAVSDVLRQRIHSERTRSLAVAGGRWQRCLFDDG
jgi:hypothetical protein